MLLVLAVAVALVIRRSRLYRGAHADEAALDIPRERTPDQLRAEADAFARAGEWALAVRARLRAVVRALEQRGDLDVRPGRTASEVAAEASIGRPDLADLLWRGVLTFGEIWYGDRTATESDDRALRALDAAVRSRQRPREGAAAGGFATPAAPA